MNYQSPEMLPGELPKPTRLEAASPYGQTPAEKTTSQSIEQGQSMPSPIMPTTAHDPASATPAMPSAALPLNPPVNPSGQQAMPAIADDMDLIEKEWVERAKQIVEHTKHDPYIQNREITKIKADYLKKRYNKEIKMGHD